MLTSNSKLCSKSIFSRSYHKSKVFEERSVWKQNPKGLMCCLRSKNVAGPIDSSVYEASNQLLLSYIWKVLANFQHGIFMGWLMETWFLVGGWWLMGLLSKVQGSVVWQVSDASFLMHRWHWWMGSLGNQFWCFMWLWRGNVLFFFPLNLEHKTFASSGMSRAWYTLMYFVYFICLSSTHHIRQLSMFFDCLLLLVWPPHLDQTCVVLLSKLFKACLLLRSNFLHQDFQGSRGPLHNIQIIVTETSTKEGRYLVTGIILSRLLTRMDNWSLSSRKCFVCHFKMCRLSCSWCEQMWIIRSTVTSPKIMFILTFSDLSSYNGCGKKKNQHVGIKLLKGYTSTFQTLH